MPPAYTVTRRERARRSLYIAHLLSVCSLVLIHGGNEAQAIAALLHDAVEDRGGQPTFDKIVRRFGPDVASMVADCTDAWGEPKPPWRARKEAYLAALPHKPPSSLLVSLADKVDNAKAILNDYQAIGNGVWNRFNGGREGTIWYYKTLSTIFERVMPGPLTSQLASAVRGFADKPA